MTKAEHKALENEVGCKLTPKQAAEWKRYFAGFKRIVVRRKRKTSRKPLCASCRKALATLDTTKWTPRGYVHRSCPR